MKTKKPSKLPVQQTQELNLSLCPHCYCMTKTLDGMCGKCKREKTVKQAQEWEKEFNKIVNEYVGEVSDEKEKIMVIFEPIDVVEKLKFFIRSLLASQKQEMVEKIERAERNAINEGIKKFGVYKYDYMEGVFIMKFSLLDILSALEKEGKI